LSRTSSIRPAIHDRQLGELADIISTLRNRGSVTAEVFAFVAQVLKR
jgi:hypothetical protein